MGTLLFISPPKKNLQSNLLHRTHSCPFAVHLPLIDTLTNDLVLLNSLKV